MSARGNAHHEPGPDVLAPALARVDAWLRDEATRSRFDRRGITTRWSVEADTDGSLLLLPQNGPEPGFAIIPTAAEFEVLIADPDDAVELGPFPSLDRALQEIAGWLEAAVAVQPYRA